MGKWIVSVYKDCLHNWPYPPSNTTFVVPQNYVYKTAHVTTGDISAYVDDLIQNKPLSIPNNMNKLDTAVNIDEK